MIEILGNIFGEIPSKFDWRAAWTGPSHVHLALSIPHDLVPATAEEAHILEATYREMWMNGPTLLTLQHRHEGHRVPGAGQHPPESVQVSKDSITVRHIVTIGERDQVIGTDRNALSSDLSRGSGSRPLLIVCSIGRSPFASFLPGLRI
jgi:hypothetical protein